MSRALLLAAALAAAMSAAPSTARAQDSLAAPRAAGQVGERSDGYVAILVSTPGDALRRAVAQVNITRRALYAQLAVKRGLQPAEVGTIATCTIFQRLSEGDYYQWSDGVWRRVGPQGLGTLASYCG